MDTTQTEFVAVAAADLDLNNEVRILNDLDLTLVGGGQGDVAFG